MNFLFYCLEISFSKYNLAFRRHPLDVKDNSKANELVDARCSL